MQAQSFEVLNPSKRPSQYILRSWGTEQGLTTETTNHLIQSPDGYVWVGTYTGLHRFDGKRFTVYNNQNSDLPSSNILRLGLDSKQRLWLGTLHGLAYMEEGKVTIPINSKAATDYAVESMLITSDDRIWVSSKSNHLWEYKDQQLIDHSAEFKVSGSTILTMAEGNDGSIYFGTDDSRFIVHDTAGNITEFKFPEEVNGVNEILRVGNILYVGTSLGLYTFDNDRLTKAAILDQISVNSMVENEDDMLWIGTYQGLYRYNQVTQSLDSLTETEGLPNNIIRDLIIDRQGNLWGGTYRKGVFLLTDGSITSYTQNDGLSTNVVASVVQLPDSSFLIGNENSQFDLIKDGVISKYDPPISFPNARLKNLYMDSKNRVWASTYRGLFLMDGAKSKAFTIENGFPDNYTRMVYEDKDGVIWVGTKNAGLVRFNENQETWEVINQSKGLTSDYIMSIIENPSGQLVVGTINGINVLDDSKVVKQIVIKDGLPSNFSFSTYPTDKYLWIASNDGLIGYSDEKTVVFTVDNGLPFNIVYFILGDEDGNLWIPGEKAILKINLKELESVADGIKEEFEIASFDKSHGMKNSHCLGAVYSYRDKDGNFWVPTQGGVVKVDPDVLNVSFSDVEPILEDISLDQKSIYQPGTVTRVPPDYNRLSFSFTGINFKHLESISFRYKLVPYDADWITSKGQRNASYTNLSPGKYRFILEAGANQKFGGNQFETEVIIKAFWWQTIWARFLIIFSFVAMSLVVYWLRVRTLTRRNKRLEEMVDTRTRELEAQKNELTTTLENLKKAQEQVIQSEKMASVGTLAAGVAHEINNPLNFIRGGLFGLDRHLKDKDGELSDEASKFINVIDEGIARASRIVNSLNEFSHPGDDENESCNLHHIIENCLNMLQHNLKHGITVVKEFNQIDPVIHGNNGKLHQIILNILANAVHAMESTGTITIQSEIHKNQVILKFTDTGSGIAPQHMAKLTEPFFTTKEPGKGTGLGLSLTYSMIKEHHGELEFDSALGKGTTVIVRLPL